MTAISNGSGGLSGGVANTPSTFSSSASAAHALTTTHIGTVFIAVSVM
jgi:hypothetical protein